MRLAASSIVAFALIVGFMCGRPRPAPAAPIATKAHDPVSLLFWTINEERLTFHKRVLRLDQRLCRIAAAHAIDMVEHDYFDHRSLNGRSPFDRMAESHYRFVYAGENLALDTDPISASAALWRSREHRRNLLEPHFKHVGIAALPWTAGWIVIVEDFTD